ncbi:putative polyketide synthase [Sclerotinia borealis F-4128]|uniref:Putative polyketide synthase n=1 Tax=Sclerotinia borealis (strain F-4128) TaxID=1432307 RepID=W9C7B3_SCLBF|nr:putative polyketide synthase [Sclerotinia borealis F-4128]
MEELLKLSELPWVEDHKINDTIIYLAVGVLVMAIEAAKQLADPARLIKGFKLTDTYFMVALTIPASAQGIETQLVFSPPPGSSDRNTASWKFRLFSHDGTQWQEHSHGTIHIDYARRPNDLEGHEDLERLKGAQAAYSAVRESAVFRRTKDEFYDSAFKSGYTFGPLFRAMDDVAYSDRFSRRATASINCFEWKDTDGRDHFQEHVVHPVTLDGILQVSLAAFNRAGENVGSTAIFAEIEYIWVSRDGLCYQYADMVRSVGTFNNHGNVGYETSVIALDSSSSRVVLEAKGIKLRFVTGVAPAQDQARHPHLCYSIEWKPDIDLLKSNAHPPTTDTQTQAVDYKDILPGAQTLLVNFLDLLTFKKPDMKILHVTGPEVDVGNGTIVEELFHCQQGGTDPVLPCSELVSRSSTLQSTDTDTYDLVVGSCRSMLDTLDKTHRFLKPGGKLALLLENNPRIEHTEVNGYHTNNDVGFQRGPMSENSYSLRRSETSDVEYKGALENAGFTNILCSTTSTMDAAKLVTASKPRNAIVPKTLMNYVLVIEATPFQEEMARVLRSKFDGVALTCTICYLDQLTKTEEDSQQTLILFPELERSLLQNPSPAEFSRLRDALVSTKGLLWLTRRDEDGLLQPDRAMADGLTRVLRSENGQAVIVTAVLTHSPIPDQAEQIFTLVHATDFGTTNQEYEASYLQVDGGIHIGRLRPMANLSRTVFNKSSTYQSKVLPFGEAPPLRLAVETPGLLDSLYFDQDVLAEEPLSPGWVEIRVIAVGLNFKDLLLALGRENGTTFGNECAGVIHRTGGDTPFKIGDRVCVFSPTAFSTYTRVKAEYVARVPDEVSLSHAAAVPTQFVTAWYAIHTAARMQNGESILIHSAAGGTGQAALQIAQLLGCEVFATVGAEEKKRFLINHYGISEDHIFYSRNTTFARGILRLTAGRGIDVIINSLSGDMLLASWDIIAPHGRFIELGKKDIAANNGLPMRPFLRRATFTALEIGATAADFGILGKENIEHVLSIFVKERLHPVENFQVLPISHIKEGMRALQSGQSIGKIVFDMADDALVPVRVRSQSAWQLDSNKTYVIAGGTGGLGLMIAEWMVKQKGARYLLLLSRSGIKQSAIEAVNTVSNLRELGAVIEAPECDISDIDALRNVLERCRGSMPTIAGCVQSSMVLKDTVFTNMSHEDWVASTNPKVRGSWNLHTVLPGGLNFFILISSISGIVGSAGQANYAAGNTYMDALAHYRNALGERAVALDLGVMLDHGFLATNDALRNRILSAGLLRGISSSELLAILDHYCDPTSPISSLHTAQVAIGLAPASEFRAASLQAHSSHLSLPFYRHIFAGAAEPDQEASGDKFLEARRRQDFVSAKSPSDAGVIVSQALLERLATMTPGLRDRMDVKHLDERIQTFGVDSLQAIELRSWFAREFAADIPIFVILGEETLASIGLLVAEKSKLRV